MSDYIEKALRTESIIGADTRILNVFDVLDTLNSNLDYVVDKQADSLKKYIYYGKKSNQIPIAEGRLPDIEVPTLSEEQLRLLHAGLGMLTEAHEFLKPVLESILHMEPLDFVNLKEELGDSMWYGAIACDVLGTTMEIEQERNIAKLSLRYPEKFSSDKAINRDTSAERKVLEND